MNLDSNFALQPDTTLLHHQVFLKEGVPGTPQPYSIRSDNMLTLALLLCLVLFVLALGKWGRPLTRQVKNFFYPSHNANADVPSSTAFFLTFMVGVDSLLLAIGSYVYATDGGAPLFTIESQPLVVVVLLGAFLTYFLVKWMAYSVVNGVFFGSKKTQQWTNTFLLLTALEGALMFPLVMLLVYFDLSVENALIYFGFVLFLNKILSFYKCWNIFFRQNGLSLQIFLYFCALEIAPLLAFGGLWLWLINSLKVNF